MGLTRFLRFVSLVPASVPGDNRGRGFSRSGGLVKGAGSTRATVESSPGPPGRPETFLICAIASRLPRHVRLQSS